MKLVIEIPEKIYNYVNAEWKDIPNPTIESPISIICNAIINGTPLPKGHGRLIDADAEAKKGGLDKATKYGNEDAEQQHFSYSTMMMYEIADILDDADVIIEADKEDCQKEAHGCTYGGVSWGGTYKADKED